MLLLFTSVKAVIPLPAQLNIWFLTYVLLFFFVDHEHLYSEPIRFYFKCVCLAAHFVENVFY